MDETYRLTVPLDSTKGQLPPSKAGAGHSSMFNNCHISYGLPFQIACAKHIDSTFHASRVYILSSRTLAEKTSSLRDLQEALGDKIVGVKTGLKAHTSWNDVLYMKRECLDLKVDVIVTLGGGSLSDAAKMLSLVSNAMPVCRSHTKRYTRSSPTM